ncbi:MAG TPA: hypothetical protein VFU19_07165 [Iamia sp.]|nr:hypothetical protein [Iamia sp.]
MSNAVDDRPDIGSDRRQSRRRKLETTWVIGVVLFTLARFGAAWGALADHPRWAAWTFGVIDLATAVPYAVGTARLVTSLIDRRAQAAARWGLVAAGSFLAPYLWIAWIGRDGSLPTVVYVAVAVCIVCFGANAVLSVRRKVAQGREEAPPAGRYPEAIGPAGHRSA